MRRTVIAGILLLAAGCSSSEPTGMPSEPHGTCREGVQQAVSQEPSEEPIPSLDLQEVEDDVIESLNLARVSIIEDKNSPGLFVGTAWLPDGKSFKLELNYKDGQLAGYRAGAVADGEARTSSSERYHSSREIDTRVGRGTQSGTAPKERYYRDSHGAIISETETENNLWTIRSKISSMPDSLERAYWEGMLQALDAEWTRIKRQGPVWHQ